MVDVEVYYTFRNIIFRLIYVNTGEKGRNFLAQFNKRKFMILFFRNIDGFVCDFITKNINLLGRRFWILDRFKSELAILFLIK